MPRHRKNYHSDEVFRGIVMNISYICTRIDDMMINWKMYKLQYSFKFEFEFSLGERSGDENWSFPAPPQLRFSWHLRTLKYKTSDFTSTLLGW